MMAKDYSGRAAKASPAVALFDAFIRAVPRSAGERSFSSALHQLMRLLIEVGTDFHIDDGSILCQSRYRRVSSAGVFGAMDQSFYFRAVSANSSFAECYERFRRAAPWLSWSVYENEEGWRRGPATPKSSEPMPSRVGAGTCIEALHEADSSDGRLEIGAAGAPLWRVTSMQDDRIILGRYVSAGRGAVGSPKQLMKLSRGEWAIWQRALAVKLRQVPATEIELPPAERGCKQFPASAQWSDGLVFLSAAIDAVPVEADEATVAAALAVGMGLAMDMRLAFRGADIEVLKGTRFSVAGFNPFDPKWYGQACSSGGGTYQAVWEKAASIAPWKSYGVVGAANPLKPVRFAPKMKLADYSAVGGDSDDGMEHDLRGFHPFWRCLAISNDSITVGRFAWNADAPSDTKAFDRDGWERYQSGIAAAIGAALDAAGAKKVKRDSEFESA